MLIIHMFSCLIPTAVIYLIYMQYFVLDQYLSMRNYVTLLLVQEYAGSQYNLRIKHPCCQYHMLIVHQYTETNVMHFLFSLLRIKGLYMFRALLAHLQVPLVKHLLRMSK
jgi:hypothetical protein